jgi:hypothetical protein
VKQLKENSILKIRCTVHNSPRDIYLVKTLDQAKKLFNSAYIIPGVDWTKVGSFYEFMTGEELSERIPSGWRRWGYSDKYDKVQAQIEKTSSEFKEEVLNRFTVVPFTPSIKDFRSTVKEWSLGSRVMVLPNDRNVNKRYGSNSQTSQLYHVLLANSHNMAILIEGVLYENPCKLCEFAMNKIAGECEIYANNNMKVKMCTPRLTFNTQLFTGREVSTLQEVDYNEVFTLWSEDQKLEV